MSIRWLAQIDVDSGEDPRLFPWALVGPAGLLSLLALTQQDSCHDLDKGRKPTTTSTLIIDASLCILY